MKMIYLFFLLMCCNLYTLRVEGLVSTGGKLVERDSLLGNRLKFVTTSICSDLEMAKVDLNNSNVLFLCSKDMLFVTRLQDINDKDIRNSILLMREFESFGLSPLMTIQNDTYSCVFYFEPNLNLTVMGWTLLLKRQSITGHKSVPPIILLPYKVFIEFPNHLYQTKIVLTDFFAEPFLRWKICCRQVLLKYIRKYVVLINKLENTCAGSGLFTLHAVHVTHYGIVLGLENAGKITYYNLASLSNTNFCRTVDCRNLYLVDALMTTRYLIILTSSGILVSNDLLAVTNCSKRQVMTFTFKFVWTSDDWRVLKSKMRGNLKPIVGCNHHVAPELNIQETVLFSKTNSSSVYFSNPPYDKWESITLLKDSRKKLLDYIFDEHRQRIIMLHLTPSSTRILTVVQYPSTIPAHNSYTFPQSFEASALIEHPASRNLFVIGNEIWVSEDNGVDFRLLHSLQNDTVLVTPYYMNKKGEYFFITKRGILLYGKLGAWRVISKSMFTENPVNYANLLYSSFSVNANDTIVTVTKFLKFTNDFSLETSIFPITEILKENEPAIGNKLFIEHISARQAILYQYNDGSSTEPIFQPYHLGKLLKHKSNGSALIGEVIIEGLPPYFTNAISIDWIEPFSPEQINPFDIVIKLTDIDKFTGKNLFTNSSDVVTVESKSGGGWSNSDEGKTVAIPGYPSIFLIQYVDGTKMLGLSTGRSKKNIWEKYEGQWFLYSFWSGETRELLLELSEDECKFETQFIGGSNEKNENNFMVDLKEKLNLTIRIAYTGKGIKPVTKPNIYSTMTNPEIFDVAATKFVDNNDILLNLLVFPKGRKDGVSILSVNIPDASLKCSTSLQFAIYSCCPRNKVLIVNYGFSVSDGNGNVSKEVEQSYQNLPRNYRPPSKYGVAVPTSKNIYNADPAVPRWQDKTAMSRATGEFKQCAGKKSRTACGCSRKMESSQSVAYSDCKRKVIKIRHPMHIVLNLSLLREEYLLDWSSFISIEELNERIDFSIITRDNEELMPISKQTNFFSTHARLRLEGSGLYHFRVIVNPGVSKCDLTDEIQVFAVPLSLPYPFYYMWNCLVVIVTGIVLLATYIWYSIAHPSINRFHRQHQGTKASTMQSMTF